MKKRMNRDKQWGEFGLRLQEAAKKGDWQQMKSIYREQIDFLRKEKRSYSHILKALMHCDLMEAKSQKVVTGVKISTSRDARVCKKCRALEGKVFPIDEAMRLNPLPVQCDNEHPCRCVYAYLTK
jgi:hypothetical protein